MAKHSLRNVLAASWCVWLWIIGSSASALDSSSAGLSNKKPVMLAAQQIGYDEHTSTAVAAGHVEVTQGDTILLADYVTYNQKTDIVHATGHVSLLEPTGDVLFSDDVVLQQSMEKGVVENFRARLKDNSLFAANEAKKINKNVTRLDHAVYSPCSLCASLGGERAQSAPLWQVAAQKVTIDEEAQRVKYQNAFMDVYGVPVLYTPYFSHPTPDAPSQSGLLQPQYYHSTLLGNVVKEPVYITFAPNMDMTLTPWYISGENSPMLQGEFRYLGEGSSLEMRGAAIKAYARDAAGDLTTGTELRDYIDIHGRMKLSEHWNSGMDVERTSDNTFLAFYGIGWQDLLTSRLYAERIEDRNYAVVESLAFQGLQPQDIANQSPYILPQFNMHLESAPLSAANSRLTLDSNVMVLERQVGDSDQRISSTAGWKIPYITQDGQVMELSATVRGDGYNIINQTVNPITGATFSGQAGRVIPQIAFDWRYPFINRFSDTASLTVAPVIEAAASPNLHMSSDIPNEDSQIAELNDINLFSPNRFAGLDEVESGMRGTYGMRGQLLLGYEKYFEWLLGQAYEENTANPFPITETAVAHFSDYIGRMALKYKELDAAYSFRLDRETLSPISNEVTADLTLKPVTLDATYLLLHNEPIFGDRKEMFGSAAIDLSRYWTWNISGRKDLGSSETTSANATAAALNNAGALNLLTPEGGTVGLGTGLTFHNECMMVMSNVGRNYINIGDVRPSTTFSVTLVLKNFGLPQSAPGSSNIAPGSEKSTAAGELMSSPGYNDAPPNSYEQNLFDHIYTDTSKLN